jgi:hypothetical protein
MVQPGVFALGKKKSTTFLPRKSFSETFRPSSSGTVKSGALSLMSMRPRSTEHGIVHRARGAVAAALAVALLAPIAPAQRNAKVPQGPRAVGVVVWRSDGTTSSGKAKPLTPFLVPVTFYYQRRFFDAGLYKATPRPMALDSDTIYETQRTGEPVGLFTVDAAVRTDGTWIANGRYKDTTVPEAPKKKKYDASKDSDEGPPKLRYPKASDNKPAAEQKPTADNDSSAASSAPADSKSSGSSSGSGSGDEGGGPPRLKRAGTPETKTDSAAHPSPKEGERLGHPQTAAAPEGKGAEATTSKPAETKPPAAPAAPAKAGEFLVAVSDAKSPLPRDFAFRWSPEEQQRLTREMRGLAAEEIARYAEQRYGYKPSAPAAAPRGAKTAAPTVSDALDDFSVRAFDLDTDNYPELVVSASRKLPVTIASGVPASVETFYVTFAVRVELNPNGSDKLTRMLTYNTDDRHLDQFPRMELLDAVDADGGGVGDLLFRTTGLRWNPQEPSTWGFRLYRPGPDKLEKVFDSAGMEN